MSLITTGIAVLVSFAAQADLTGPWTTSDGHVQMIVDKQDQGTTSCKVIQIELSKQERVVNLKNFHLECGAMLVMDMEPVEFELQNGVLYVESHAVGFFTDDRIQFHLQKDAGRLIKDVELVMDAKNEVQLRYLWTDGFTQLLFDGKMTKL